MVTWSCLYSTSQVNMSEGKHWIRKYAMKAPASHVSENGHYNKGLLKAAKTVSDKHDTDLCPNKIRVSGIQQSCPHAWRISLSNSPISSSPFFFSLFFYLNSTPCYNTYIQCNILIDRYWH